MDKLLELADRCEAATGPDRVLDATIWDKAYGGHGHLCFETPRYTASLDAAMTLVDLEVGANGRGHAFYPNIDRVTHDLGATHHWVVWLRRTPDRWRAEGATPALALCAAALRARAASQNDVDALQPANSAVE